MKSLSSLLLASFLILGVSGCGDNKEDKFDPSTDNEYNDWNLVNSKGYSGAGVLFSGQVIVGEWQVERTKDNSGGDAYFNIFSGPQFTENGVFYKYRLDLVNGNSGWYNEGTYGVSRDGLEFTIDRSAYRYKSIVNTDSSYGYCIIAVEELTDDEYRFCKISDSTDY